MDTFPIVKRTAEKQHGHYRTNETIFQIYDALSAAIQSGHPYQTLLHPPPARILNLKTTHPTPLHENT